MKKTFLLHITNKCNNTCKYCYGSFAGNSYKDTCNNKKEVSLENLLEIADDLSTLGFQRAHICGGEPFLRDDIWPFLLKLSENDIESFVLSNITFIPPEFTKYFISGIFTNLSFSLDSINRAYNDFVRGNTTTVMSNIRKIVQMKKEYGIHTELGLYIVVTKKNIAYLDELIDWADDIGLDYISLQLVYLPKNHPYYEQFVVTSEYRKNLIPVFDHLHSMDKRCRVSGDVLFEMTKQFLLGGNLSAVNCFCERGIYFLFIDAFGNIRFCPSKHEKSNQIIGNICEKRLRDIELPNSNEDIICSEFSPDCIGIWEIAHPSNFDIRV